MGLGEVRLGSTRGASLELSGGANVSYGTDGLGERGGGLGERGGGRGREEEY